MSAKYYGSFDLTKLIEKAKEGHSAFRKADNGHIYFNVQMWLNDQPDKFGNICSLQLQQKKDAPETEKKQYFGNLKLSEQQDSGPVTAADVEDLGGDLPF